MYDLCRCPGMNGWIQVILGSQTCRVKAPTTVDSSGISKNVHVKSTHLNVEPKIEQCDLKIEIAVESINLRKSFICSTLYRYLYDRDAYKQYLPS